MNYRGLKDNGYGWAQGGMVQFEWADFIVEFNSFEQRHQVIHESIGMQSPFKDKDGKVIYEGDLIETGAYKNMLVCYGAFVAGIDDYQIEFPVYGWYIIFADGGTYSLSQDAKGYSKRSGECTIIGNKHENKNLLSPQQLI